MSAAELDAGFGLAAARGGPDEVSRRLESLPASSVLWRLVIMLSLGGREEGTQTLAIDLFHRSSGGSDQ
jgi:hypothetical protein